jgi:hypothetical protein
MKTDELEAEELLRQMGRLVVPLLPPEREAQRHERMASSVNRLLRGLPAEPLRRAVSLRALGALAAAAAGLALLFGGLRFLQGRQAPLAGVATVVSVTGEASLARLAGWHGRLVSEQRVDTRDEVRTAPGARAELALTGAGRAQVEVSESTRVSVNQRAAEQAAANEDWLDLAEGLVTLRVAKLPAGLVLSVRTPDARITVRGTRFSVRVSPRLAGGTLTSVAVTEGLVQVDSRGQQLFIGPGQQWSSQSVPLEPTPTPTLTPEEPASAESTARGMTSARARGARVGERPLEVPTRTDDAARPAPTRNSERSKPSVAANANANANANARQSTLGEENQLYAQALARAGAGDLAQALTGLAALIRDYPHSPLAQSAQADRFRLLEQAGNKSAAAQEARRYLSAYPNGFARVEARRIALIGLEAPQ